MFKASIALVVLAFGTLAYGWIRGNDFLLYSSIGFSALAGLALWRSTVQERRAHPELTRRGREARAATGRREVLKERDRRSLMELRNELSELKGVVEDPELGAAARKPLKPFGERLVDEEPDERPEEPAPRVRRDRNVSLEQRVRRPQPAGGSTDDFRSRLSAVLGEDAGPDMGGGPDDEEPFRPQVRRPSSQPSPGARARQAPDDLDELEDDLEVGSDWIRIDDLPRMRGATQERGGYGRSEEPPSAPKRRTSPGATTKKTPSSTTKRAPAREAPAKPRAPRSTKADASEPRTRPKPKA